MYCNTKLINHVIASSIVRNAIVMLTYIYCPFHYKSFIKRRVGIKNGITSFRVFYSSL